MIQEKGKQILSTMDVKSNLLVNFDNSKTNAYISMRKFEGIEPTPENIQAVVDSLTQMGMKAIDIESVKLMFERAIARKQYLVAQGTPSIDGEDAKVVYHFSTDKDTPSFKEDESGKIDFRELQLVENVDPGQLVAEITAESEGSPGFDVFGKPIKQRIGKKARLKIGKNVVMGDDGLKAFATAGGRAVMVSDRLTVEEVLNISGDVDFNVGNIFFKGDVVISGSVLEGFKVRSEGSILVRKNVERASLFANGDIEIQGNTFGRGNVAIEAGGDVKLKLIENGNVKAGGDITVSQYALHSDIVAKRKVFIANNHRKALVGGSVKSCKGIEATFAGSFSSHVKTELEIYLDEEILEEIREIKGQLATEDDEGKLLSLNKRLESLKQEVEVMKSSEIVVKGEIYTGTTVKIFSKTRPIKRDLSRVIFYYDADSGNIGSKDFLK